MFEGRSTKLIKVWKKPEKEDRERRKWLKYNQEGIKKEYLLRKTAKCFLKRKSLKCQL